MEQKSIWGPPSRRTSVIEAHIVLYELADIYQKAFQDSEQPFKTAKFIEVFLKPLWEDENTSGERQIDEFKETMEMAEWEGEPVVTSVMREVMTHMMITGVASAFAIQSIKAEKNSASAWFYACEANHWLGRLQGYTSGKAVNSRQDFSRKGAEAKNMPMQKLKKWVFDKYDNGNWPSAHKASFDIAPEALKKAPIFGTRMSSQRAQQTIYEWLRGRIKSQFAD
ncbi:hypothetical protein [Collimonas pratensis]|nr:hypothetical protein [Collimonas pratensis]